MKAGGPPCTSNSMAWISICWPRCTTLSRGDRFAYGLVGSKIQALQDHRITPPAEHTQQELAAVRTDPGLRNNASLTLNLAAESRVKLGDARKSLWMIRMNRGEVAQDDGGRGERSKRLRLRSGRAGRSGRVEGRSSGGFRALSS